MAKGEKGITQDEREVLAAIFFGIRLWSRAAEHKILTREAAAAESVADADALIAAFEKIG
jgi:hypothetical protein